MSAHAQSNNSGQDEIPAHITRLGLSGHTPKDIEQFEQMGFVMSGKRRKRKLQTDDPAQKLFGLSKEQKALKETELVARFKEMIEERKGNG